MDHRKQHSEDVRCNVEGLGKDHAIQELSRTWLRDTLKHRYSYNFSWLSRPIIQYPQDMAAMQELIWLVKPDLIIETGVAHGGSIIFSASMLALLDYCDACESGKALQPGNSKRRVLGIDIDIRPHNRAAIEEHPLAGHIDLIQGSSIAPEVISQVHAVATSFRRVMVCLDSNHTHDHVLAELEAYAPLISQNSYCVVFDTVIEDLPDETFPDRPWGKGNNPKTAVWEYLRRLQQGGRRGSDGAPLDLEIDMAIQHKLLITVAPDGYLRRLPR